MSGLSMDLGVCGHCLGVLTTSRALDDVHEIHCRSLASRPHPSPYVKSLDLGDICRINGLDRQRALKRNIVRSGQNKNSTGGIDVHGDSLVIEEGYHGLDPL
jgi:molybdate-binding protein